MNQLRILIVSDDADFALSIVGRWQAERTVPEFIERTPASLDRSAMPDYDLAIIGGLQSESAVGVLSDIEYGSRPVLFVAHRAPEAQAVRGAHPRVLVLQDHEGWANPAVMLAAECLRRVDASNRARRAEQTVTSTQRHAVLGRYMLEVRHSLNNALTSILGNSELLLLEPDGLSASVRDQVATIHSMSMRVHEIIQRFSSLDTEMQFAENQSQHEMQRAQAVAGAD